MPLDTRTKAINENAIRDAFEANPDIDKYAGRKAIQVIEATWQWDDNENVQSFGSGDAYRETYYPTGDTNLCCLCMDGGPGGASPYFSTAFQNFSYDSAENRLVIRGDMKGRRYTAILQFGGH